MSIRRSISSESKNIDLSDCSVDEIIENCDSCDTKTLHEVVIAIAEMTSDSDTAKYSREPQRVSQCVDCGKTTTEWLTRT